MGNKQKLIFEVEEGGTLDCKECPFAVKRFDEHLGEYEYICNVDKNPFNCGKYDLTTLKIIKEHKLKESNLVADDIAYIHKLIRELQVSYNATIGCYPKVAEIFNNSKKQN